MSEFSRTFLERGRLKEVIIQGGDSYKLEGDNKWIARYRCPPNKKLVVSKILIGLFDISELRNLSPDEIPVGDRASAALAVKTAGGTAGIPEVWKVFARDFYSSM